MNNKLKQAVTAVQVGNSGKYKIEKAVNIIIQLSVNVEQSYLEDLIRQGVNVTITKVR